MTSAIPMDTIPREIQEVLKHKSKVERDKESVTPTVINDSLIKKYIKQYNKENKIFDKDNMPLWELDHLQLSYKNIIEINNLTGMEKLTILQLDNNIITEIKNLDHLVNLTWLDLSFNLITKIKGLNNLKKLTDLSLYNNRIDEVSGLENLNNLNVLSLGMNRLRDHINVLEYLKSLKNNLQVLKLVDNPFVKTNSSSANDDYRILSIVKLGDKLKYVDYELISEEEREKAKTAQ